MLNTSVQLNELFNEHFHNQLIQPGQIPVKFLKRFNFSKIDLLFRRLIQAEDQFM